MSVTVATWNIHGSARPDLDQIAARLEDLGADVVALQEVQRRQSSSLAGALQWTTENWSFKHWPFGNPFEGLAVLSLHPLVDGRTVTLSMGAPPWSYRRRIAQLCTFDIGGRPLRLANCHLSSDDADARFAQAQRLLAELEPMSFVVGDLNVRPGRPVHQLLLGAGLRDAWGELHPDAAETDGATNWRPRDPDDRPTNRIDYILVPAGYEIVSNMVPSAVDNDLGVYRRLSDHLPLRAELEHPPDE